MASDATNPDPEVRAAAATISDTPPAVLASLATDESLTVRQRVASNPHTPPGALRQLAGEWKTARFVIQNENCPPEIIDETWDKRGQLDRFAGGELIGWVAAHRNTSNRVLLEAIEARSDVGHLIVERKAVTPEILDAVMATAKKDPWLASAVIGHAGCTPEQMRAFTKRRKTAEVWRSVGENPSAPSDMVAVVAARPEPELRKLAAGHPNASEGTLQELIWDPDDTVKQTARERPDLPEELQVAVAFDV